MVYQVDGGLRCGSYRHTLMVQDRLGYGIVHLPRVFLSPRLSGVNHATSIPHLAPTMT